MKRKILGIVIIAVVLISTAAFSQKAESRNGWGNRGEMQLQRDRDFSQRGERMQLFTDEQQEAIKKIRLETEKEVKPLRNNLNELQARHRTLTTAEKADLNAINKNIDEMGKIKTDIAKIQAKQQQEIRKLLTEEQLARFDNPRRTGFDGNRGNRPAMNRMDRPGRPTR